MRVRTGSARGVHLSPAHAHACVHACAHHLHSRVCLLLKTTRPTQILLRHADSEVTKVVKDHERSISREGRQEASSIAAQLKKVGGGVRSRVRVLASKAAQQPRSP